MKPKNNIVHCYGCHRSKMLFETKAKADNFIKYNKDNILEENGFAPVRSYYCEFCCGYHVTSNSSTAVGEMINEKEHEILMQFDSSILVESEFNKFYNDALSKIDQAESNLLVGDFSKIEKLSEEIGNLRTKYKVLHHLPNKKREKFVNITKKIEALENLASKVKSIINKDEKEINSFLSIDNPTEEQSKLIQIVKGFLLTNYVVKEIERIESFVKEGEIEKAFEYKENLRLYVCSRIDIRKSKTECNKKINELEHIISQKRKEIEANTPISEEESPISVRAMDEKSYKSKVLEIINILEEIKRLYDDGDFDTCETKIDIADFILSEICTEDDNTRTLKLLINKWKQIFTSDNKFYEI